MQYSSLFVHSTCGFCHNEKTSLLQTITEKKIKTGLWLSCVHSVGHTLRLAANQIKANHLHISLLFMIIILLLTTTPTPHRVLT